MTAKKPYICQAIFVAENIILRIFVDLQDHLSEVNEQFSVFGDSYYAMIQLYIEISRQPNNSWNASNLELCNLYIWQESSYANDVASGSSQDSETSIH